MNRVREVRHGISYSLPPRSVVSDLGSSSGESDTAFVVERGGTLRNVIIGKTVGEGVYCIGGGCNLEYLWFEDVCEDAISIVSKIACPQGSCAI